MNQQSRGLSWKFSIGLGLILLISIPLINLVNGLLSSFIDSGWQQLVSTVVEIGIVLLLANLLFNKLVVDRLKQIISWLDTDHSKPSESNDELGELVSSIEGSEVGCDSENVISQVSNEISNLSIYSQELSASSKEGNKTVKATNNLIEDMLTDIQEISAGSEEVTGFAQEASSQTQQGRNNIEQTIGNIEEINQVVDKTVTTMKELNDNTEQIGEIIDLITNIADQTNMLALNAAIEASRAGEEGQGFAVVAEEIRELAEETASATNDIIEIVKATQQKSNQGLDYIEQVSVKAKEGKEVAQETNQVFHQIENVSQEVANMIEQTATAAQNLAENSDQLMEKSEVISDIFDIVADSSAELADISSNVDNLVNDTALESGDQVELIKWDKSCAIGVDKIDRQHQELFDRVNKLILAHREGRGREEIAEIIDFLADYTVKHFSDEEEIQRESGYPDHERHKGIHESFVQDVVDFKEDFEAGKVTTPMMMKFNRKIADWLVNHVKGIDQQLGQHINQQTK
ncbi:MAG: bacteriohemerythrin [Bacillota bacterium]